MLHWCEHNAMFWQSAEHTAQLRLRLRLRRVGVWASGRVASGGYYANPLECQLGFADFGKQQDKAERQRSWRWRLEGRQRQYPLACGMCTCVGECNCNAWWGVCTARHLLYLFVVVLGVWALRWLFGWSCLPQRKSLNFILVVAHSRLSAWVDGGLGFRENVRRRFSENMNMRNI